MNSVQGSGPLADSTGAVATALMVKYAMPERLLDRPVQDLIAPVKIAGMFADAEHTYPVHTPAAAWTSAAAYHDSLATDPELGRVIKEACDWFGISSEWDRLSAARPPAPVPAPVAMWGLPASQKYPLDSDRQVKFAIEYYQKYANRLSPDDRRTFAGQLVKAASDKPHLLSGDNLWRMEAEAGLGLPAPGWKTELLYRAKAAKELGYEDLSEALQKIASDSHEVGGGGDSPNGNFSSAGSFRTAGELADILGKIDLGMWGNGEKASWGKSSALEGLVGDTPSTVRAKLAQVVQGSSGRWYSIADLDRVPDELCSRLGGLGPIVSRRAKAEQLAKSASFERLVESQGIEPLQSRAVPKTDWLAEAARS